jgi:aminoglycoside phosphotransferase (APT) family kinase protein
VKFALEKLRVAQDWRAPVSRNAAEYAWLAFAGQALPGAAPRLYGRDADMGGFAMELVEGRLWKTEMLAGRSDGAEAPAVARALGLIHAAGTASGPDSAVFANMALFEAIRIDPYLRFTASRHPGLAPQLTGLADALARAGQTLIHGDISPKNIILRDGGPVFLDAECATMGDPAFDVAFCVNHLVLKGFHRPEARAALWGAVAAFWQGYAPHVRWEAPDALEARVAALLPALMLARIDGKSPVEYLTEARRAEVRQQAIPLIAAPAPRLSEVIRRLEAA